MKFKVKLRRVSENVIYYEEHNEDLPNIDEARKWAIDLVNKYNSGFIPCACKLEFLDIELIKLVWDICESCNNYGCVYDMSVNATPIYYECAKMRTEAENKLVDKDKEIDQLEKKLKEQEALMESQSEDF